MLEVLVRLPRLIEAFYDHHPYSALFVIIALEEMCFPIPLPPEVLIARAGFRAARGAVSLWLSGAVACLASMVGFCVLYAVSRRGGRALLRRLAPRLHFDVTSLNRVERWLEERGTWMIFLARLVPGLRLPSVIAAGLLAVPFWQFFIYASLAAAVRVGVTLYLGVAAADLLLADARLASASGRFLLTLLALLLFAAWLIVRWRRRRGEQAAASHSSLLTPPTRHDGPGSTP